MSRRSFSFAVALAVWGACGAVAALLAAAWLGRSLGPGELVLVGMAMVVPVALALHALQRRQRRKVQDMRDSALW